MNKWKDIIASEKDGQIIRIFRPPEIHALISASEVKMETKYKFLQSHGITTEDVKSWFYFFLYTGCRIPEAILIHSNSTLYNDRGIIRLPNYKGKEKRKMKGRNIFLSAKGRNYIKPFFESNQIPSEDYDEIRQSMRALTTIMHNAGKVIRLPEEQYTIRYKKRNKDEITGQIKMKMEETGKFTKNSDGTYSKTMKEKPDTIEKEKIIITNGCMLRSFRHTWESWLYWGLGDIGNMTVSQIILSQGHEKDTSLKHYLNLSFDKQEDLKQIIEEVSGFGEVG